MKKQIFLVLALLGLSTSSNFAGHNSDSIINEENWQRKAGQLGFYGSTDFFYYSTELWAEYDGIDFTGWALASAGGNSVHATLSSPLDYEWSGAYNTAESTETGKAIYVLEVYKGGSAAFDVNW